MELLVLLQAVPDSLDALSWVERLGVIGVVLFVLAAIMSGKLQPERYVQRLEDELTSERADHEATRQELRTCRDQEQKRAQEWQRLAEDARAELERANILLGIQGQSPPRRRA